MLSPAGPPYCKWVETGFHNLRRPESHLFLSTGGQDWPRRSSPLAYLWRTFWPEPLGRRGCKSRNFLSVFSGLVWLRGRATTLICSSNICCARPARLSVLHCTAEVRDLIPSAASCQHRLNRRCGSIPSPVSGTGRLGDRRAGRQQPQSLHCETAMKLHGCKSRSDITSLKRLICTSPRHALRQSGSWRRLPLLQLRAARYGDSLKRWTTSHRRRRGSGTAFRTTSVPTLSTWHHSPDFVAHELLEHRQAGLGLVPVRSRNPLDG